MPPHSETLFVVRPVHEFFHGDVVGLVLLEADDDLPGNYGNNNSDTDDEFQFVSLASIHPLISSGARREEAGAALCLWQRIALNPYFHRPTPFCQSNSIWR